MSWSDLIGGLMPEGKLQKGQTRGAGACYVDTDNWKWLFRAGYYSGHFGLKLYSQIIVDCRLRVETYWGSLTRGTFAVCRSFC